MLYRVALFAVATTFAALGVAPLLWTYGIAVWTRSDELVALASSSTAWLALGRSLALGTLSALGAISLAAPLALWTGKVRARGRNALSAVALVPLALPPYNVALALHDWLPDDPLLASSFVLTLALYPIPFVFLRAALASIDPALEEAGLVARGKLETLRRVTWPLVRASAVASAGIVFLLGLGEFGTAAFLGLSVYPGQIALRFAATYDAAGAAVAALPFAGVVVALLAAESLVLRRVAFYSTRWRPALSLSLGKWRLPLALSCLAIVALSPGLPLLFTALEVDPPGLARALPMAMRPALNSFLVALTGTLAALIVALALALVARRGIFAYRWVSLTFFVVPGAVLGVGLIGFWNHPILPPLYGSLAMLVMAVVLRYSLLAERTITAGLESVPVAQEQVARLAGRGDASIAARILGPQIATPLLAGACAFVLFVLRDLDTVVTIYPPGGETLAVRLYTVMANSPQGLRAALSLAQMALTLPVVLLLLFIVRKRRWLF